MRGPRPRIASSLVSLAVTLGVTVVPGLAAAATGTDVCGTLPPQSTWSALGAPWRVCPDGVQVPDGGTLTLDEGAGPFSVIIESDQGITSTGGSLVTSHDSPAATVSIRRADGDPYSFNIDFGRPVTGGSSTVDLSYLAVSGFADVYLGPDGTATVRHSTFTTTRDLASVTVNGFSGSVSDSVVSLPYCDAAAGSYALSVTGAAIRDWTQGGCGGLSVNGPNPMAIDNRVDDATSPNDHTVPAIRVWGTFTVGQAGSVYGNVGSNDELPYVGLHGGTSSDIVWQDVGTGSGEVPLGYLADELVVNAPGRVLLPPRTRLIIEWYLNVVGSRFDSPGPDSVIEGLRDIGGGQVDVSDPSGWFGGSTSPDGAPAEVNIAGTRVVSDLVMRGTAAVPTKATVVSSDLRGTMRTNYADVVVPDSAIANLDVYNLVNDVGDQTVTLLRNSAERVGIDAGSGAVVLDDNQVSYTAADTPVTVSTTGPVQILRNSVTRAGSASTTPRLAAPAMVVVANMVTLGPGGDIDGNTGANNGLDAIALGGRLAANATWLSPYNAPFRHPLGYAVDGLQVASGATLTLPAAAYVPVSPPGVGYELQVFGRLDASAGGARFEGVGLTFVPSLGWPLPTGIIRDAFIDNYLIYRPPVDVKPDTTVLDVDGLVGPAFVSTLDVPVRLRHLDLFPSPSYSNGAVVDLSGADNSTVSDSVVRSDMFESGLSLNGTVQVSGMRATGATYGISGRNGASVTCATPDGSVAKVSGDKLTITQSNLPQGGSTYSAQGGTVSAPQNWWGQPTGPTPTQNSGAVDASSPLLTPSPCASAAPVARTDPVTGLIAVPEPGGATLTWQLPSTVSNVKVVAETGTVPPASPQDGTVVYDGAGTTTSVAGQPFGAPISYTVFSSDGSGAPPGEAFVTVGDALPAPVVDLAASEVTSGSVALSWTSPPDAANVVVRMSRGVLAPQQPDDGMAVPVSGSSALATGLDPTSAYSFSVFSLDNAGNSSAAATTLADAVMVGASSFAHPASAVTHLSVHGRSDRITVSWQAPISGEASGYHLTVNPGSLSRDVGPTATTTTFIGLREGESYAVRIAPLGDGAPTYGHGIPHIVAGDFTGDGDSDIAVYRPSSGTWYIRGHASVRYGALGDVPLNMDANGDGVTDIAVYRPTTSTWYIRGSQGVRYGIRGDIPAPGDYNGDGKTDLAVFRPTTGTWYIRGLPAVRFGVLGDVPVASDYNGDGKTDIAVFRPATGTWYIRGVHAIRFGSKGDHPVPADWNGDGSSELAVFRPATSVWYVRGLPSIRFGSAGDTPLSFDFDGNGVADIAVFRPTNHTWYIRGLYSVSYGARADIPL